MDSNQLEVYKKKMLHLLEVELAAQQEQAASSYQSFSELKKSGLGIYPIRIKQQSYGITEYPEITFIPPTGQSLEKLRQQSKAEFFSQDGEVIKANLFYVSEEEGKIQLWADDFPEWMSTQKVGIRVGADEKTIQLAKEAIEALNPTNPYTRILTNEAQLDSNNTNFSFQASDKLNASQNQAIQDILSDSRISILHGPPGTGKTTTLVEAIHQIVQQGEKVIAVAPSNMAVDHLANSLIERDINVLRIGNTSKISENLYQHTIEGRLSKGSVFQEIKKMRIQAQEFRRMASQYRRNFGKEEREQRQAIWKHYKTLQKDIQKTIDFYKEKWQDEAQVICGTPIGLAQEVKNQDFKILVIDEAGQCLQPLAWIVLQSHFEKVVLAGDPFQLPPTVISSEAQKQGLSTSILDKMMDSLPAQLLDTQYRMSEQIAGFSSQYFYQGKLKTPESRSGEEASILFYDTAGTGYEEEKGDDGSSLMNSGELELTSKIIQHLNLPKDEVAFISPYSGQVSKAIETALGVAKISTIDSFQGQEFPIILLSLVRSNTTNEIGFLKDYRRMNVAMTRAHKKLIIIGDSATIGQDEFYQQLLTHLEKLNAYHSAWEITY